MQQKWASRGLAKMGERHAGLVAGMGSAAALVQAGVQMSGSGSAGKELCCAEKLLSLCSLSQIRIEALH